MQEEFYKFRRLYKSDVGISENFYDILPDRLTLNKVGWYQDPRPYEQHETLFKEIEIVPFMHTQITNDFVKAVKKTTSVDDKEWVYKVYETLKDIVYRLWQPDRYHVIAHSGGVDSRILSNIILDLYEEHGEGWLGDILFVENGGEGDVFKEIMQIQGWGEDQYLVYNEDVHPNDYHAYGLDFKNMWKKHNGVMSFPYHMYYDSYKHLQEDGIIPDNPQCFGAFGPYIENGLRRHDMAFFIKRDYYYQVHNYSMPYEWVFPWFSVEHVKEISKYKICRKLARPRISDLINSAIMPDVPNVKHKDILAKGYRHISDSLMQRIIDDYEQSWYGRNYRKGGYSNFIHYSDWWGYYCEASICEHLLEMGYKIKI